MDMTAIPPAVLANVGHRLEEIARAVAARGGKSFTVEMPRPGLKVGLPGRNIRFEVRAGDGQEVLLRPARPVDRAALAEHALELEAYLPVGLVTRRTPPRRPGNPDSLIHRIAGISAAVRSQFRGSVPG